MPNAARIGAFVIVGAVAAAAGVYLARAPERPREVPALVQLSLPDLSGKAQTLAQYRGKVVILNFWASWCAPCRQEIPGLLKIQQKYAANGVQVVGIAVDNAANTRQAAADLGISYPILVGGFETVELTRELGNKMGALPYTAILDREGLLVGTHLGIVTESQLEQFVRSAAELIR